MPRLDGTGPLARGPGTGWGRGNCRGAQVSPPTDQTQTGVGTGRGGRGRCWSWLVSSRLQDPGSDELAALKDELARTKEELAGLQARLAEPGDKS